MARFRRCVTALVAVVLAVLATAAPANAQSGTYTREQAWAQCGKALNVYLTGYPSDTGAKCLEQHSAETNSGDLSCIRGDAGLCHYNGGFGNFWYYSGCPADKPWDANTKKCGNDCALRTPLTGALFQSATPCVDGCSYSRSVNKRNDVRVNDKTLFAGTAWAPTGQSCSTPPEPPKPEECLPIDGQTLCFKPDGSHCATASNGRQICFRPGETGSKTDGDTRMDVQPGPQHNPPAPQLPSGDTLIPKGGPTVINNSTTNVTNNTVNSSVTNTSTSGTQNGTNAGSKNQGGDTGGTGDTPAGEGDGKGEGTSAAGGGSCEDPPIITGDAALGMVATQAWATRCATDAGNAAKVTGDVGDCASPFSVEGTNANAVKLRAMRAQICNEPNWAKRGDGDGTGKPDDDGKDGEPGFLGLQVDTDMLDTSGFTGGGTCPALGVLDMGPFGLFSLDSDPMFCDLVQLMRMALLMIGGFIALRILLGE